MTLSSWEGRVGLDTSVKVTSQDLLNLSRGNDVAGLHVRKLNPVVQDVVCHPKDLAVAAYTTRLCIAGKRVTVLLLNVLGSKLSTSNPVVLLRAHDLTSKPELGCSAQACKFLKN
mgnify:CR=1 FL=1